MGREACWQDREGGKQTGRQADRISGESGEGGGIGFVQRQEISVQQMQPSVCFFDTRGMAIAGCCRAGPCGSAPDGVH